MKMFAFLTVMIAIMQTYSNITTRTSSFEVDITDALNVTSIRGDGAQNAVASEDV